MPSDRLRVFVSSKMAELAAERAAIKEVLDELEVDAWVFELDAGARTETIETTFREQLRDSDLYIGVFWKGYGAYTIDEFELARETDTDCLIYQKGGADAEGRDPQLQAFLDKIGEVETGLTVQFFDTPDQLRELVKRDTARWQTRIVRRYREAGQRSGVAALPADPNLVVLRNKVKQFWVDGVLGRAVAESGGLIDLAKQSRPEAVAAASRREPDGTGADGGGPVPEASATEIFDRLGGGLVILGDPGSGKTTTALRVVRDLVARAERDASAPVPVVLNLSAYSPDFRTLAAWVVREISRKYHVPPAISSTWLEQDRLVLVLDGLDEVAADARPACGRAIDELARRYGAGSLLVTSRLAEYEALPEPLGLHGAIVLEPLELAQVETHLERAGEELSGLRKALTADRELRELARTPLMVSVMRLAYRGRPAEEVATDEAESAEERGARLFGAYVDRAFGEREARGEYTREALTSWLSWLARRMAERSRTLFLIEDMQPAWLATRGQLGAYLVGLASVLGLIFGGLTILYRLNPSMLPPVGAVDPPSAGESAGWVVACTLFFLGIGGVESLGLRHVAAPGGGREAWWRVAARVAVLALLWVPLALALDELFRPGRFEVDVVVPAAAIAMGFAALGARQSIAHRIETAESLALEPASAARGVLWGLLAGLPFALITFFYLRAAGGEVPSWAGLFWCLMAGALGAVFAGFRPHLVRGKTLPNQGIRLTARTALHAGRMTLPLTAIGALPALALGGDYLRADLLAVWTIVFLPFFGVCLASWFGGLDVCKHYLLRLVIGATRQGPFDFPRALAEAGQRNLVQRVGGGYMFTHRPLLDHFAALNLPPPAAEEIRDPERQRDGSSGRAVAAMAGTALLGAVVLAVGLTAGARTLVAVGAILSGVAIQWLVIRSAVASAFGAARRRDPED